MATKRQRAQDQGDQAVYEVVTPLHHDGEAYAPGDAVTLDSVAAKPLLDAGVVKPAG